jgi:hypothetical protein
LPLMAYAGPPGLLPPQRYSQSIPTKFSMAATAAIAAHPIQERLPSLTPFFLFTCRNPSEAHLQVTSHTRRLSYSCGMKQGDEFAMFCLAPHAPRHSDSISRCQLSRCPSHCIQRQGMYSMPPVGSHTSIPRAPGSASAPGDPLEPRNSTSICTRLCDSSCYQACQFRDTISNALLAFRFQSESNSHDSVRSMKAWSCARFANTQN